MFLPKHFHKNFSIFLSALFIGIFFFHSALFFRFSYSFLSLLIGFILAIWRCWGTLNVFLDRITCVLYRFRFLLVYIFMISKAFDWPPLSLRNFRVFTINFLFFRWLIPLLIPIVTFCGFSDKSRTILQLNSTNFKNCKKIH